MKKDLKETEEVQNLLKANDEDMVYMVHKMTSMFLDNQGLLVLQALRANLEPLARKETMEIMDQKVTKVQEEKMEVLEQWVFQDRLAKEGQKVEKDLQVCEVT